MAKKQTHKVGLAKVAGVAGALAAVAGAYFIYGTKEGSKAKKKIKSFAIKAKGEMLEKLEKMKDVTEESYKKAVSDVMKKYDKLKTEHGPEVDAVVKELNGYWNHLRKHLKTEVKKVAKVAKKVENKVRKA